MNNLGCNWGHNWNKVKKKGLILIQLKELKNKDESITSNQIQGFS